MNKRIASIVFNPFVNDTRILKQAISLANKGYDVEVVAHLDKGLLEDEVKENFKIKRVSYLDRKKTRGFLGKLKAYLSFVYKAVKYTKTFDYLHCNDLNALPIGFIVKQFYNKNVKVIYDAHEYEIEINGLKGSRKRLIALIERNLIKYADKVITVSDAIANEYMRLYKIEKPALVLNTPVYKNVKKKDIFRNVFGLKKTQSIFLYQGGLSKGRGIEILLETFKLLWQEVEQEQESYPVIVFMGYGILEKQVKCCALEYKNIYFHEAVKPEVLLDYTSSADFGILFYEDTCLNHRYCSPNKIFEYLMAELPVIVSNLYEMKRLVESNRVGIVAQRNTALDLKEAIDEILLFDKKELKSNIQNIKHIYNWENQEKVLLEVYQ